MPLVKVKRKFQVTIPFGIREQIILREGDVLEASVEGNSILLKPKIVVDRQTAVDELMQVLRKPVAKNHFVGMDDEEVMHKVNGLIQEVRAEKLTSRHLAK